MTTNVTMTVRLNGTDHNPYARYGLKQNPFPQTDHNAAGNQILANLAAEPIKDLDDLRSRLVGCSQEFIDGCCQRFKKGEMIEFKITYFRG